VPAAAVSTPTILPRPAGPPPYPPSVRLLLAQARQGIREAEDTLDPVERFLQAYLAALRAAAAVLAVRARPHRRTRPASAWALLPSYAPELAEWSAFFAAISATRAAVEAGVPRLVTARQADDLVRQVGTFLGLVERVVARTLR
jgi:hypothetical protein